MLIKLTGFLVPFCSSNPVGELLFKFGLPLISATQCSLLLMLAELLVWLLLTSFLLTVSPPLLMLLLQLLLRLLLRPALLTGRSKPLLLSASTVAGIFLVSTCGARSADGNLGGRTEVEYETLVTFGLVDMLACFEMTPTGLVFIMP